jgi:D-hydroxyproline dehydrogenase subunit gamma
MFTRPERGTIVFLFQGREIRAHIGDSIAAALLAEGVLATRTTPVGGAPRGPFCMMGACFDCLAEVDGVGGVQTCLVPVRAGMRVTRQEGARALPPEAQA